MIQTQTMYRWAGKQQQQQQLNLANCVPKLTVVSHNFSGIFFRVNNVLYIGVIQPSKLPINLQKLSFIQQWIEEYMPLNIEEYYHP